MFLKLLRPFSFLPALLLMYMIYSFSAQPGEVSSELSYKVSYKMVETVDYVFDGGHEVWQIAEMAQKINFITRKLAHMAEYFALAVAMAFPLYVYGLRGIWLMLVAGIICIGFACGDEYHQSFIAGRSPSKKDVVIDSSGVLLGIILVRIIGWTGRQTLFKPRTPKPKKTKRLFGRKKNIQQEYGAYPPYQGYNGPIPPQNQFPPNGQYPPQNQFPPNGQYPPQNQFPPNGQYPPQNQVPPQGQYPFQNQLSPKEPPQQEKKEKDWIFDDFV